MSRRQDKIAATRAKVLGEMQDQAAQEHARGAAAAPPAALKTDTHVSKPAVVTLSAHISSTLLDLAAAAFMADFHDFDDGYAVFVDWVVEALDAHIQRGATGRKVAVSACREVEPGQSGSRAWRVSPGVVARVDAALIDDSKGGVGSSRSSFIVDALRVAVSVTERRRGAALVPFEGRIPQKLRK